MNRPTSWEVKEALEREECDVDVVQQFSQSMVHKTMSSLEAEVYVEVHGISTDTCKDNEDIGNIKEEQYTYEDIIIHESGLTKDEEDKIMSVSTNTKV